MMTTEKVRQFRAALAEVIAASPDRRAEVRREILGLLMPESEEAVLPHSAVVLRQAVAAGTQTREYLGDLLDKAEVDGLKGLLAGLERLAEHDMLAWRRGKAMKKSLPAKSDEEAVSLRNEAAALVVRTARLAPDFTAAVLWALYKSKKHRDAILTGPSGVTTALLFSLVPEARSVFAASAAGKARISAADKADKDGYAAAELSIEHIPVALVQQIPEAALPLARRLMGLNSTARFVEKELSAAILELIPAGAKLPAMAKEPEEES